MEQAGHTPWVAGRPFFIVMAWALLIYLLDRRFTQYASIGIPPSRKYWRISYNMSRRKSANSNALERRQPSVCTIEHSQYTLDT